MINKIVLKFDYDPKNINDIFDRKLKKIESDKDIDVNIITVSNGVIYKIDELYLLTTLKNQIFEIMIDNLDQYQLIVVDIKELSKKYKQLFNKIESNIITLNKFFTKLKKETTFKTFKENTIEDIKEQLMINGSL